MLLTLSLDAEILDQELISYRYSSCSCCCSSWYWGDLLKKSKAVVSNLDLDAGGTKAIQASTHQLTEH